MPQVSVIIPTFNRARLVRRAVLSVLAQSFADCEVIVVDDGSSDDTDARVAALGGERIRYVRLPVNRGVTVARNQGLKLAAGRYIAFLDSDDEWLPDKLALQVAMFDRAPDSLGLIYTGVVSLNAAGRRHVEVPRHRGRLYREMLVRNLVHGGGSNAMIRRDVVSRIGLMDESLPAIEDYDYWLRIARHYDIDFIAAPLMIYHDPERGHGDDGQARKSLDHDGNMRARELFFFKHVQEMRRMGVADRFLMDSARRYRRRGRMDEARRVARQALRENGLNVEALLYLCSPLAVQVASTAARRVRGAREGSSP